MSNFHQFREHKPYLLIELVLKRNTAGQALNLELNIKLKWLLVTLWLALICKEISWLVIGLDFWHQQGLGEVVTFVLPAVIIVLALLTFIYGFSGLKQPALRKISIASIFSAVICFSLATIGLWGVIFGGR